LGKKDYKKSKLFWGLAAAGQERAGGLFEPAIRGIFD
jgi:hypothetical protein